MGEIREYKINGTIIIGIDHGFGSNRSEETSGCRD